MAFLAMEWYLVGREANGVSSYVNHIDWRDDSLIIYFSKKNRDQEVLDMTTPWNVKSNPKNQEFPQENVLEIYLPVNVLENFF